MISFLRKRAQELLYSQDGNVLMLVGCGALMLVIAAGTAIDMSRSQILQMKISSALDAAGLAAGAATLNVPQGEDPNSWVQQHAQRYFNVNFPSGYLESTPAIAVTTTLSNNNTTVNLSASTQQSTSFMSIIGVNNLTVSASSQVTRGAPVTTELVLVLDNTGSMANPVNSSDSAVSKMDALKSAASSMVTYLFASNNNYTNPNLYIGLVPFSETVNISQSTSNPLNWMQSGDYAQKNNPNLFPWGPSPANTVDTGGWAGCVTARDYPYDVTDDPPSASSYQTGFMFFWYWDFQPQFSTINTWVDPTTPLDPTGTVYIAPFSFTNLPYSTTTHGPNLFCPQPMVPMTPNQSTILTGINNMIATGDTDIDIGAAWGWRMLSPKWNGIWGGDMATYDLPKPYPSATNTNNNVSKVMVLMSDGWNHFTPTNYTAYGTAYDASSQQLLGTIDETQQEALLDARTKWVCDSLRYNGVIVYTIAFGVNDVETNPSSADYSLLQYCATDASHFFAAPTNTELQNAFKSIANSLVNLRVSQ